MKTLKKGKSFILVNYTLLYVVSGVLMIMPGGAGSIAGAAMLVVFTVLSGIYFLSDGARAARLCYLALSVGCGGIIGFNAFSVQNLYYPHSPVPFAFAVTATLAVTGLMLLTFRSEIAPNSPPEREGSSYAEYKKASRLMWFATLPFGIYGEPSTKKAVRLVVMVGSVFAGFFLCVLFFSSPALDDCVKGVLSTSVAVFGLAYFLCGMLNSLFMTGGYLLITSVSVFLAKSLQGVEALSGAPFNRILLVSDAALLAAGAVILWMGVRWDLVYSNVQVFERGDDSIAIDLFLADCKPIEGLSNLVEYEMAFSDLKQLITALKIMLNASHLSHSVLAGYHSSSQENKIRFFVYSNDSARFEGILRRRMARLGVAGVEFTARSDPEWECYCELYPDPTEMASLINRNLIEELYTNGLSPDRQYDVHFFISFDSKHDPLAFEESVIYLGFTLTFASRSTLKDGTECFIGEYQIHSYVTPRRIDYLCANLSEAAKEFGARFNGDWDVI